MGDCAILARSISKRFSRELGHGHALHEAFERITRLPADPIRSAPEGIGGSNWALRDVSFPIRHGESVGLIGHNGAGKSVLLRILARITRPTTGQVQLEGRVGAVLEVGAGFHRELTIRENIYLNGAILGMKKREIARKFDDIVAFSELGAVVDRPLKTCSTGMDVRLAFSIAAHLEPEILLMDEVLAVADESFQAACVERLQSLSREGRTILLASHDVNLISEVCPRTIWLDHGRLVMQSETGAVAARYHAWMATAKAGPSL